MSASDDVQGDTAQTISASGGTGGSQPGNQEISRWSPDTSSMAASAASGGLQGQQPSAQHSASATPADSVRAARGSTDGDETKADSVEEERARTAFALEHGGQRTSSNERTAEIYTGRMTEDPTAAQQMSSSGQGARRARRRQ
ncbi:hypothetical protein FQN54_009825 [Arachnomyces sp. PD_36]|nr:hypothetical protein FQN54_009825 [Arachnomyces sp. PD_36]